MAQGLDTSIQYLGRFEQNPSPHLRLVYRTLSGSSGGIDHQWQGRVEREMSAAGLAVAVAGCAVLSHAFEGYVVPGLTFPSWLEEEEARHGPYLPVYKRQIQSNQSDYDTFMRELYEARLKTPAFRQDATFRSAAVLATSQVARLLIEHLNADGSGVSSAWAGSKEQLLSWTARLEDILADAVFSKCVVSRAGEKFSLPWAKSGAEFDASNMKATHGPKAAVLVSVFSGLTMIQGETERALAKNVVMTTSKEEV